MTSAKAWISLSDLHDPDRPEAHPEQGEEAEFFVALGKVISTWQLVECMLIIIATKCVGPERPFALDALFHASTGFRNRLDATAAAVKHARLTPQLIDKWATLENRAYKASKVRNRIAHGQTYFDSGRPVGRRIFVSENIWNHSKWEQSGHGEQALHCSELQTEATKYRELHDELWLFSGEVRKIVGSIFKNLKSPRGDFWSDDYSLSSGGGLLGAYDEKELGD